MKHLIIFFFCICSTKLTIGQTLFNTKIPNANYGQRFNNGGWGWTDGSYQNTIAHDADGNIFFLNANATNLHAEVVKLSPTGTFIDAVDIDLPYTGSAVLPGCIIPTFDGGIIVSGGYSGPVPSGYTGYGLGTHIVTPFFAKFDNNLNLLKHVLYSGWPFQRFTPTVPIFSSYPAAAQVKGIASIPVEGTHIALLGFQHVNPLAMVVKLDDNLNLLDTRWFNSPTDGLFWQKISYLDANDQVAITGKILTDDLISPYGVHPSILLIDRSLNNASPLNYVHFAGSEEQVPFSFDFDYGHYKCAGPTNAIENPNDPNQIIWGFTINSSNSFQNVEGCDISSYLSGFLLVNDLSFNPIQNREIKTCSNAEFITNIKINPAHPTQHFSVAGTEISTDPWLATLNVKPVLFNFNYDLSINNVNRYNVSDLSLYTGVWLDHTNYLQSFEPYYFGDEPSYLLHVTHSPNTNTSTSPYSRVLNTHWSGSTYCNSQESFYGTELEPQMHSKDIEYLYLEGDMFEVLELEFPHVSYTLDPCVTAPQKPATTQINKADESFSVKIFPTITSKGNINIEGVSSSNSKVSICDLTGRILFEQKLIPGQQNSIDISSLVQGLYITNIISDGKRIKSQKIIVK